MAVEGNGYNFQPTAPDPDSASLGSASPTRANIVINVSDGKDSVTLPAFTVTVTEPPRVGVAELQWTAPTINEDGTALTSLAGYKFRYGKSPKEPDAMRGRRHDDAAVRMCARPPHARLRLQILEPTCIRLSQPYQAGRRLNL